MSGTEFLFSNNYLLVYKRFVGSAYFLLTTKMPDC
uniref:Uncharacterized protein n=1 Tax=Arundo donax TaxID=35708 RepID=A0A0A9BS30_ARUDO